MMILQLCIFFNLETIKKFENPSLILSYLFLFPFDPFHPITRFVVKLLFNESVIITLLMINDWQIIVREKIKFLRKEENKLLARCTIPISLSHLLKKNDNLY